MVSLHAKNLYRSLDTPLFRTFSTVDAVIAYAEQWNCDKDTQR